MKTLFSSLLVLLAMSLQAQNNVKEVSFKVYGNCDQCKARIENALDTKGIKSAEWNMTTGMCTVVYRADKTSEETFHIAVARAGHDTDRMRATDATYESLHHCCHYERNPDLSVPQYKE